MKKLLLFVSLLTPRIFAQEASTGVDLRATLSGQMAVSSIFAGDEAKKGAAQPGFRAVFYPTAKISEHWGAAGAWQLYSRPYFFSDFDTPGKGVKGEILQGTLNYSRISEKGSVLVRAGILSTAFGSFLLRYDDADNPLVDMPPGYGYYYAPVSIGGVAGAQLDASRGKWDGRVQFANSSPANPRSVFAHDQYGNWAGGAGYTILQGLHVGVSGYRGPYLARSYEFFLPGEANPNTLPAHALAVDAEFARGHWNLQGEFQRFTLPYAAIPTFREDAGYGEVRRVLHPRWYAAARTGYTSASFGGHTEQYEFVAAYRPGRFELVKFEYELKHHSQGPPSNDNTFAVQFVATLHRSFASAR